MMQPAGKVAEINEEFFGSDRSKTYLKDDFANVLRGTIVRHIMIEILREISKARTNRRELPKGGIAFGDFDPDNAGFFANIFGIYQKGWMTEVRLLLGGRKKNSTSSTRPHREQGSGGKFVDDLATLSTDDFIDYFVQEHGTIVPPILYEKLYKEEPADRAKFIMDNRDTIGKSVSDLIDKAKRFQSCGYHDRIIKDYEALEFHKDNRPDKYDIRKESTDYPFANGYMTVRTPKSTIEIEQISKCLNDLSTIVAQYQGLVSKDTNFYMNSWPLDTFIDRTLALFVKQIPQTTRDKIGRDIVKHLHKPIDLVAWRHKDFV